MIVVSANENEKKHSISLFRKASEYVKPGKLLADSQNSAANLRETASECGTLPVIPYPRNQQEASEVFSGLTGSSGVMVLKNSKQPTRSGQRSSEFSAGSRTWQALHSIISED